MGGRPGEIDSSRARFTIDCNRDPNLRSAIHRQQKCSRYQMINYSAHLFSRVLPDVIHIGTDDFTSIALDHFEHEKDSFLVGSELRVNITQVLRQVAHRKPVLSKFLD